LEVRLSVQRYNPERQPSGWWQDYSVDLPEHATVLDALLAVRDEQDESLTLRCSCRSHICGSCTMKINDRSALACRTKLKTASERLRGGEAVRIRPAGNMPVVKDLVVDLEGFFGKVRAVEPWLQPTGPEPEREYIVPNEAMLKVREAMACILCGACVSECNTLEVDGRFLGPAALAKAWRFTEDPRDGRDHERLAMLSTAPGGIWDCTHCFACVEVCPKDVKPMERIVELRRRAMEAGYTDNNGSRHSQAFRDTIAGSGWLDETKVAVRSLRGFDELIDWVGVGAKSFLRGKVPLRHTPIPGALRVKEIIVAAERLNSGHRAEAGAAREGLGA
jgi:succinate dehydrogenase / fumarate reductase iron-sulfur subunit